jgi:hypothetical protein
MAIIPDEKDWTWILKRPCPECLFDVTTLNLELMPVLVRDLSRAWQQVLLSPTETVNLAMQILYKKHWFCTDLMSTREFFIIE